MELKYFSVVELEQASTKLSANKSPGPDGIPNEVLKIAIDVWPELLLHTVNECLLSGCFPNKWKQQNLVLLHKPNKPIENTSSYRPICLIDTSAKLLERLILQRMEVHVDSIGGLSHRQYGYRKGISTIDAINRVVTIARSVKEGNWKNKGYCALVTLDVKNAFNTARWGEIIQALNRKDFPEYLKNMVNSYLTERKIFYLTSEGTKTYDMTMGVPQGSVLGPLLWNIFYDELMELEMAENTDIVGFADDIAVVATASKTEQLEIEVNDSLDRIHRWLKMKNLQLAVHKTEAVLITDKRSFTYPKIVLDGTEIKWSKSLRYLGVQIDKKLNFKEHIHAVVVKAQTTVAKLARVMPNIGGPRQEKRILLNEVVHASILYAAPIWAKALEVKKEKQKLLSVQRRSALRVVSAYRTVAEQAVFVIAGIPPIDLVVKERAYIYDQKTRGRTDKADIKNEAKEILYQLWQRRWDEAYGGKWTHMLIPNIRRWTERKHGQVDYYLSQILSGHGAFEHYLYRFKKRASAACKYCSSAIDDVSHTIFECSAWEPGRLKIKGIFKVPFKKENLIPSIVEDEDIWEAFVAFISKILRQKELDQRRVEE